MRAPIWVTIGILVSLLQPVRAQSTASELFRIPVADRHLSRWMTGQARRGPEGRWSIWERFHAMGECAEAFLAQQLLTEKEREQRLIWTGAYLVATRQHARVLLDREIGSRKLNDRAMAMFALAVGPEQDGEGRVLQQWLSEWCKRNKPLLQVTACMALARFEHRTALPSLMLEKTEDPGVLAAALYCWPAYDSAWVRARLQQLSGHAALVWRGYLLGESCSPLVDQDRRRLALKILTSADRSRLPEAANFIARDAAVVVEDADILHQSLAVKLQLAASPALRRRLLRRVDTRLLVGDLDVDSRRWWVLFTMWASIEQVGAALAEWHEDPKFCDDARFRRAVCLALAWRLSRMPPDRVKQQAPELRMTRLLTTQVGGWLHLAAGRAGDPAASAMPEFPRLARAFRLVQSGIAESVETRPTEARPGISRRQIAALVEAALWRKGWHPRRAGIELHRQLQGELMIDGTPGTRFAANRGVGTYMAKGLQRGDEFFAVASELYRFIAEREPWLAPGRRP